MGGWPPPPLLPMHPWGLPPLDPPPPDQSDHCGKKPNVPSGKSCRAIFSTQTFHSQTPPPPCPPSHTSLIPPPPPPAISAFRFGGGRRAIGRCWCVPPARGVPRGVPHSRGCLLLCVRESAAGGGGGGGEGGALGSSSRAPEASRATSGESRRGRTARNHVQAGEGLLLTTRHHWGGGSHIPPHPPFKYWAKFSFGPSADQNLSLAPSGPPKTQHHWGVGGGWGRMHSKGRRLGGSLRSA